jgi:hypothetical protein
LLGKATSVAVSSETENVAVVRALAAAIGAGALVVLFTASYLLWRRRKRRRRFGGGKKRVLVTGRR